MHRNENTGPAVECFTSGRQLKLQEHAEGPGQTVICINLWTTEFTEEQTELESFLCVVGTQLED